MARDGAVFLAAVHAVLNDALAHIQPVVLHERAVRALMRSPAVPFGLLTIVVAATFGLAHWHPFSPSAPAALPASSGDATRGAAVFAASCAGCHGVDATGGVGPALRGSGLTAPAVAAVVATGRGTMPAGLVSGRDAADVAAHVASMAK